MAQIDQKQKTIQYAKDRHIGELFNHLTQALVYYRPENPRAFLIEEVRKLQASSTQSLFTGDDLDTMFDMIDVTKQGTISVDQLRNTCRNIAADSSTQVSEEELIAAGGPSGRVNAEAFAKIVSSLLSTKNHWSKK